MKHRLLVPLGYTLCLLVLLALVWVMWKWQNLLPGQDTAAVPVLVVSDGSPIGLIGMVTALGENTLTIEGQPPGNPAPVRLETAVDAATVITKVGPAPDYATSTAAFADLEMGMLLNIEAAGISAGGAMRHAERIVIPPSDE